MAISLSLSIKTIAMKNELKILIVDDDKFMSTLIELQLKKEGYSTVDTVKTGKECLERVGHYDLIVLDYFLENENGISVLNAIKSEHPNAQVIMLSSQEYVSVAIKSIKMGALDYFEKSKLSCLQLIEKINMIQSIGIQNIIRSPKEAQLLLNRAN